jgi:TolA-binding protein
MPGKGPRGHRITRGELKEDRFVTQIMRAVHFVDRRKREVATGAVIAVIAVAAVVFLRAQGRRREGEAAQLLAKAEIALSQRMTDEAIAGYRHLVDTFGGTRAGREAGVYLGQLLLSGGEVDEASRAFQFCLAKPPSFLLGAAAQAGLAACLEERGQTEQAVAAYEELAARYEGTHLAPEMLARAGRCRQRLQQWNEAAALFSKLVEEYPQSSLVSTARFEMAYSRTKAEAGGA